MSTSLPKLFYRCKSHVEVIQIGKNSVNRYALKRLSISNKQMILIEKLCKDIGKIERVENEQSIIFAHNFLDAKNTNIYSSIKNENYRIYYVNNKCFNKKTDACYEAISSILRQLSKQLWSDFSQEIPRGTVISNANKSSIHQGILNNGFVNKKDEEMSHLESIFSKKEIAKKISEFIAINEPLYKIDDVLPDKNKGVTVIHGVKKNEKSKSVSVELKDICHIALIPEEMIRISASFEELGYKFLIYISVPPE